MVHIAYSVQLRGHHQPAVNPYIHFQPSGDLCTAVQPAVGPGQPRRRLSLTRHRRSRAEERSKSLKF